MKKLCQAINVRGVLLLAVAAAVSACLGCASQRRADEPTETRNYPGVSPVLLVDAPGDVGLDGQRFAGRSDWPSTDAFIDLGQVTVYQEYWYDRQSVRPEHHDFTYRRFRSRRVGERIR